MSAVPAFFATEHTGYPRSEEALVDVAKSSPAALG